MSGHSHTCTCMVRVWYVAHTVPTSTMKWPRPSTRPIWQASQPPPGSEWYTSSKWRTRTITFVFVWQCCVGCCYCKARHSTLDNCINTGFDSITLVDKTRHLNYSHFDPPQGCLFVSGSLFLSLFLAHIHVYTCTCICTHVHVRTYTHRVQVQAMRMVDPQVDSQHPVLLEFPTVQQTLNKHASPMFIRDTRYHFTSMYMYT